MSDHVVTVIYTEDLVRRAAKEYWWKTVGANGFLYLALAIGLFFGWMLLGLPQWFVGFTAAAVLIWACIIIWSHFRLQKFAMARFLEMDEKVATFHFSDYGIRAEADTGKTELPWKTIDKIIQHPNFWLFSVAKSSYFTLPVEAIFGRYKTIHS